MQITEQQLEAYINLYEKEYGVRLDKERGYLQFSKLITLVLILSYPEMSVEKLEEKFGPLYNSNATHNN